MGINLINSTVSHIDPSGCKVQLTCDEDECVSEAIVDKVLVAGEARLGGGQQDLQRDVELDGVREEDRGGEQQDDDLGQPEMLQIMIHTYVKIMIHE